MKKILFIAAIAAMALTSCSKNESVDQANGKAIDFDTYIGKVTKGVPVSGIEFKDGQTMAIYSTKDGVADMDGVLATRAAGTWTYSPIMYYVKDLPYVFAAYAPVAPAGASMTEVVAYTVDTDITKQVDFMYAPATTPVTWDGQQATVMAPVKFTFKHALSQVKFSARATSDFSKMYTVKITGVTIKTVNSVSTLTTATGAWSVPTTTVNYVQPVEDYTLAYSADNTYAPLANSKVAENNNILMLMPQTWNAELDVEVALTVTAITTGGGDATLDGDKVLTAKIPAGTWERNKIYNYQMALDLTNVLNLKEITFDNPAIEDWTPETNTPIVGQ